MKRKIALIGAGSLVFARTLMNDMLSAPALDGTQYVLMSPTAHKITALRDYFTKIIADNGLSSTVECTTDRREALRDADYVILMFQIGGMEMFRHDYEIPLSYGVDQCIADTLGPGGVFRFLRTVSTLDDMAADITELCPSAYILNYVNPMGMICTYLGRYTDLRVVGLCHGVQTTLNLISSYVGVPKEDIVYTTGGINHMAWFLRLEAGGRDLYPTLRSNMEKPQYYVNEKVRGEVLRHSGYIMTESTGHLSEYLPWFRKNELERSLYCDQPAFGGESGAAYKFNQRLSDKYNRVEPLSIESGLLEERSNEYCSYIIEAIETNRPFKFTANVLNRGYISNLPADACVEVPAFADASGFQPVTVGRLPSHLAAMNQSNITVQSLAAEAAHTGDIELAFWAVAMDPLTSGVLDLKRTRDMFIELYDAQKQYFQKFGGKTLTPIDHIPIPEGTVPAEVPLDPALAIDSRFGKL